MVFIVWYQSFGDRTTSMLVGLYGDRSLVGTITQKTTQIFLRVSACVCVWVFVTLSRGQAGVEHHEPDLPKNTGYVRSGPRASLWSEIWQTSGLYCRLVFVKSFSLAETCPHVQCHEGDMQMRSSRRQRIRIKSRKLTLWRRSSI